MQKYRKSCRESVANWISDVLDWVCILWETDQRWVSPLPGNIRVSIEWWRVMHGLMRGLPPLWTSNLPRSFYCLLMWTLAYCVDHCGLLGIVSCVKWWEYLHISATRADKSYLFLKVGWTHSFIKNKTTSHNEIVLYLLFENRYYYMYDSLSY